MQFKDVIGKGKVVGVKKHKWLLVLIQLIQIVQHLAQALKDADGKILDGVILKVGFHQAQLQQEEVLEVQWVQNAGNTTEIRHYAQTKQ